MNQNEIATLRSQIGRNTFLAICGGRSEIRDGALHMAVSSGYRVVVSLEPNDTYTVRRIMKRGVKIFEKGSMTDVYADQVSDVCWAASCYKNVEFGS
jgi:hypothetical protein